MTKLVATLTLFHYYMLRKDHIILHFLNIMFQAPMGRFQLESELKLPLFSENSNGQQPRLGDRRDI